MGISLKHRYERQRLSKRSSLKHRENENMKDLWQVSTTKNLKVNPDSLLVEHSVTVARKVLVKSKQLSAEDLVFGLGYQGAITKIVTDNIPSNYIKDWSNSINKLAGF